MRSLALAMIVAAAAASGAAAQRTGLLVTVDWLAQHIADESIVLLHVGERAAFDAEHIPGARHVTLADLSAPRTEDGSGLHLELPDSATLRRRLEQLGISDDSRIVVYYGQDWVTPATRVLFTLDYIGLGGRSSLLNGGMAEWKRAGHPVTAAPAQPRTGRLSARRTNDVVVSAEIVQNLPQRYVLVDGRSRNFYDGSSEASGVRGHIPGARSIPFNTLVDDRLHIDPAQLAEAFAAAGIRTGDTIVAYCHIGQQATLVVFAARLLGYDVRLFDGSMQDWAARGLPATMAP